MILMTLHSPNVQREAHACHRSRLLVLQASVGRLKQGTVTMKMLVQSLYYLMQYLPLWNQALESVHEGEMEKRRNGPFRMAPMVPRRPDQANAGSTGHAMPAIALHIFKQIIQGADNRYSRRLDTESPSLAGVARPLTQWRHPRGSQAW